MDNMSVELANNIIDKIDKEIHAVYSGYYYIDTELIDYELLESYDVVYLVNGDSLLGLRYW